MVHLNKRIIKLHNLTDEDVARLEHLHKVKDLLFDSAEALDPEKDQDALKLYAELLVSLEYDMQKVWKFEQNSDYHSWWYQIPHCNCPKMDNSDPIYFGVRIVNASCPIHGSI